MSNPVMNQDEVRQLMPAHVEPPRMQPWLGVMSASLVPAILIIFVPQVLQIPFAIAAAVLLVAGACILIVSRWRSGLV